MKSAMKEELIEVMCELTAEEVEQRGQDLGEKTLEYNKVEAQKKDATKAYADELKTLRVDMSRLANVIQNRSETRSLPCRVEFHVPNVATKRIVRLDTGEIVREVAMTAAECQDNLFGKTPPLGGGERVM